VAQRQLRSVINKLKRTLRESRRLADDARRWSLPGARPYITKARRDGMIELAYFRSFLAWETFLEEAFILYLLGKIPPKGRAPRRFALPPDRRAAEGLVSEGREYSRWDAINVASRAQRFFRRGGHFTNPLRSKQALFEDAKKIRNAVAHESANARQKFETLVRTELGTLPAGLTVGDFLNTTKPASTPPRSFLEFYLTSIQSIADQIVPS
jgi:hypothetical protein